MARYKRGGYIFDCWIGDHTPRHFHVFDSKGNFLGRFDFENMKPIGNWKPPRKIIKYIKALVQEEGL